MSQPQALPLTLPDYIEADPARYFLALNRTAKGDWSAAYLEYENHEVLLSINDADTLEEIYVRMKSKLQRYHKKHPEHAFVSVPKPGV